MDFRFVLSRSLVASLFLYGAISNLFVVGAGCECGDVLNPITDGGGVAPACALEDNAQCTDGQVLKQGVCSASGCEVDTDCCPGTRCRLDLNTCWPHLLDGEYSCETDADCADPAQRCKEVTIGPRDPLPVCAYDRCMGDSDCGEGRSCFHSVCVETTPCAAANDGTGCLADEVCDVLTGQCSKTPAGAVGCDLPCDGVRVLSDPDIMTGEICCPTVCQCRTNPPIVPRRFGRYARIALSGGEVVVSAYDAEYGDLVLIRHKADGTVSSIKYLDGIPGGTPTADPNGPRGGVREPGPNVGTHTALASNASGRLRIAYHDVDNRSLKVAIQVPGDWQIYTLDTPSSSGEESKARVGVFNDVAIDEDGTIWISYLVHDVLGTPGIGGEASGLKIARSLNAEPQSAADWQLVYVDTRPAIDPCEGACGAGEGCVLDGDPTCRPTAEDCPDTCSGSEVCAELDEPDGDGNTTACFPPPLPAAPDGFPRARGLHTAVATQGGAAIVSYYDSIDGDLRLARVPAAGEPEVFVLDGDGEDGRRTGDVGRFPSVYAGATDVTVAYTDFGRHQLRLWQGVVGEAGTFSTLDDGTSPDAPGLSFVGAGGRIAGAPGGPLVVYQDASNLNLKLAEQDGSAFSSQVLLDEGGHGFYADVTLTEDTAFIVSVQARLDARGREASRMTVLPRALP